jgi:hypothetical protein
MKRVNKKLSLSQNDYYRQHLAIVNAFLPIKLTNKEIDVLGLFMSFKGVLEKDRFGTTARKIVMSELNLSSGGLGNYINSLKKKGFITKDMQIPKLLVPSEGKQEYYFILENTQVNAKE